MNKIISFVRSWKHLIIHFKSHFWNPQNQLQGLTDKDLYFLNKNKLGGGGGLLEIESKDRCRVVTKEGEASGSWILSRYLHLIHLSGKGSWRNAMTWIRQIWTFLCPLLCISIGVCCAYARAPTLEEPKRGAWVSPETRWFATSLQQRGLHKKRTIDYHWSNSLNLRGDVNRLICEGDLLILSFFYCPLFHCIFCGRQQEEKGCTTASVCCCWQIFIICVYIYMFLLGACGAQRVCFNGSLLFLLIPFFFPEKPSVRCGLLLLLICPLTSARRWSLLKVRPFLYSWFWCCCCQCNGDM